MSANNFSLPVGAPLPHWQPRPRPAAVTLTGRLCRLQPLQLEHADALFAAFAKAPDGRDWLYMTAGPFADAQAYREHVKCIAGQVDPLHFALIELASHQPLGTLALMRQEPQHGVVEVGTVCFSPALQGTAMATEAQFLLMSYVFDGLGYRRYEWKCDSLNERSIRAAKRLGFQYEGCFRKAMVYKGRSRDTAWFSIIDSDWPSIKEALQHWLNPQNFDESGKQIRRLQEMRGQS